jgi:hypothetical protein
VAEWVRLRDAESNITNKEVARRLGISSSALSDSISRGMKEGWLKLTDPMDQVEHLLIPKVVDNLNFFLDAKDPKVTIETAKGTLFKVFQESKGISEAQQTVLALKIEYPEGSPMSATGKIVGRPRIVEGEVLKND